MDILNYALSAIASTIIVFEAILIHKRNRTIKVKGNDDIFIFALVMLAYFALAPLNSVAILSESIRNILILVALFGTFGIKRGISERGIEKICFTIPWEDIESIHFDEGGAYRAVMTIKSKKTKIKMKLQFKKPHLRNAVYHLQQQGGFQVYIHESLDKDLKRK